MLSMSISRKPHHRTAALPQPRPRSRNASTLFQLHVLGCFELWFEHDRLDKRWERLVEPQSTCHEREGSASPLCSPARSDPVVTPTGTFAQH